MLNETGVRESDRRGFRIHAHDHWMRDAVQHLEANFAETARTGSNSLFGIILTAAGAGGRGDLWLGDDILDTLFG